jgi:hypothetical protein
MGMDEIGLLNTRNIESLNSLSEYLITLVLDKADARLIQYRERGNEHMLNKVIASYRTATRLWTKLNRAGLRFSRYFGVRMPGSYMNMQLKLAGRQITMRRGCIFEKSRGCFIDDQLKEDRYIQIRKQRI